MSVSSTSAVLPVLRKGMVLRAVGPRRHVAKLSGGEYFELGDEEAFLLQSLDGQQDAESICLGFQQKFGEQLHTDDVLAFCEMAAQKGLAQTHAEDQGTIPSATQDSITKTKSPETKKRQSLLYCRKSLWDPHGAFEILEPLLRWLWTVEFLVVSGLAIAWAGCIVVQQRGELISSFAGAMRIESLVVVWFTLVGATLLHECAHGLTCRHFGGEVREIGVLLMFFTPCFYCNVSDAWLISEKWKRLCITLAGAYCDLCLWALAVFLWRVTTSGTLVNHIAWVVITICGARILFNFNPLMKLDGYYLLSDWAEMPNLRRRGWDRWFGALRWVLWGAPRPAPEPRGTFLTLYGLVSWTFSAGFILVVMSTMAGLVSARGSWIAGALTFVLGFASFQRLFRGVGVDEMLKMLKTRRSRTVAWIVGLAAVPLVTMLLRLEERSGGSFHTRPGHRVEVRAEVAGFLRELSCEEGQQVTAGQVLARLEVPDLTSQIAQKQAGVEESLANLRRLEAGPRPEEVQEQRARIARASAWSDRARADLRKASQGYAAELARLDQQVKQARTELEFTFQTASQSERLFRKGVLAGEQLRSERKRYQVAESQWMQAQAQKQGREASGLLEFETEAARRDKELADEEAKLKLLEAGSRREEIDAEKARLLRLREELAYFTGLVPKLTAPSPVSGVVTTPYLREKIGQYLEKGALICTVEDIATLEVEIAVPEEEMEGIRAGQLIELKTRAQALQTYQAEVIRIAPVAITESPEHPGRLAVYCHVANPQAALRPGMTGYARIYRERESVARILLRRLYRYIRTEFWW